MPKQVPMERKMADGGHTFVKKTFHKPTYCHHCSDLIWGLIQQGFICEVCNFVVHERCVTNVVTPCSGIAPCIIKNPVAHCWSEPTHHKRKFCTVCRKRLDETPAVHCLICEYFAHTECQDFAVPDCTENATYVPGKELLNVKHQHHWREGNLPPTSKCAYCKKTCWSSECLTGYRCEWCGMTTHGGCRTYLPTECSFGILQPIYLPPHAVSIPRTEVPIEAIIGVQVKSKTALVRDYSCPELSTLGCDESRPTTTTDASTTIEKSATVTKISTTTTAYLANTRGAAELSLREILFNERQRREKSKYNFLFSSTPSSSSNISTAPTTPSSPLFPLSLFTPTVGESQTSPAALEGEQELFSFEDTAQSESTTVPASSQKIQTTVQKSPSASSSLHLLYTSLFRKIKHGRRRKHRSTNTDEDDGDDGDDDEEEEDEEDGGVCDISGNFSDDYDHCDVELRERTTLRGGVRGGRGRGRGGGGSHRGTHAGSGSDVDYHGDAEAEAPPRGSFYETSDTGGELTTTDDIDSSMNLISNISYNSSNSNTSIDNRSSVDKCKNVYNVQLTTAGVPLKRPQGTIDKGSNATAATATATNIPTAANPTVLERTSKTGAITKPKLLILSALHGTKGGSVSSPYSSESPSVSPIPPQTDSTGQRVPSEVTATIPVTVSPVGRSKSFQEPGVKEYIQQPQAPPRQRKYGRFFQRRRSKRSSSDAGTKSGNNGKSPIVTTQGIAITIQDEDGNYQPYDDNYLALSSVRSSKSRAHTGNENDDDDGDDEYTHDDAQARYPENRQYLDNRPRPRSYSDDAAGDISDGGSSLSRSRASDNEHVFNRLLKRMQRFSLGWRKPRYHKRRARSISEEFSSGDAPRFKDEESVSKNESMHGTNVSGGSGSGAGGPGGGGSGGGGGGSAAGCSSAGSSHYKPDSTSHKTDKTEKSDKDREKKEKEKEEKDLETIKVFDGINSFRRQLYRVIVVSRTFTLEQLLTTALRAFHITRDPSAFYLTDLYAPAGMEDTPLQDPTPILSLTHLEGKRPAIYVRFQDKDKGFVRVYPGRLQCSLEEPYVSVPVDNTTIIKDLIRDALDKFGLQDNQIQDYRCSEVLLDRGVTERILSWNERPWEIMKQLGKDSIRQMELMRFYMQHKQDPHGPNIALFVGNLPPGLSQRNYEQILSKYLTDENKFTSIGPIYYEYGSVVLTFEDAQKAVRAFYNLRETIIEDKKLLVILLPNIEPSMIPPDTRPLLVFVNVKSGGCQGLELISSFRKLLNPYQVFDLDNGGPLPGLYVFRQIANYRILVCGGDGTIGWVLQCLDNVGQDSECSSPPCAIVPLGTGNDLARVLCWGSGYTGGEDPLNLLRDVIEAEEIRLDRWTVVFHPEDKPEEPALKAPSNTTGKKKKAHQAHLSQQTNQHHQLPAITSSDISGGGAQNEDNSQIFVMNNYFGIGVDADLCLDFHNAREENPNKFNSRLHNKGYYVKMGLRKIVGRKTVKDLHKELRLEVDGKVVELPPVEGIIILNILSWGSGANPWGPDKDDNFTTPNHYDGVLEVVGVSGVVHLGQIQSGIRTAMRIAQGGHIKIHLYSDMPVQVDGEPWVQSPGDVVVLKSALKATMLKKTKSKRRLTEPHISPAVFTLSASATASATAIQGGSTTTLSTAGQGLVPENGDRDKEPPATMLKKNKSKMKRRNTEPTMIIVPGVTTPQMSLALPPTPAEGDTDTASNNTDF